MAREVPRRPGAPRGATARRGGGETYLAEGRFVDAVAAFDKVGAITWTQCRADPSGVAQCRPVA